MSSGQTVCRQDVTGYGYILSVHILFTFCLRTFCLRTFCPSTELIILLLFYSMLSDVTVNDSLYLCAYRGLDLRLK